MAKLYRVIPLVGASALLGFACSSNSSDGTPGASGGAVGIGGTLGSGGAVASGGAVGAGGAVASGGAAATGGGSDTGGADAAGGTGTGGGSACPEAWGTTGTEAGIEAFGNIYHYFDECYSSIATTATAGSICTEGSAAVVVDEMYSEIWGAGVGVQVVADMPSDLSAYTGFKYTIDTPPSDLRVGVIVQGDDNSYFTEDFAAGENVVFFNQLANGSWVDPPGTLDLTKIVDIQWQVPSNGTAAVPFDFCISAIELISDEPPVGTGGASGSGGGSGSGGEPGSGGAGDSGGSPGSGGATNSGGSGGTN